MKMLLEVMACVLAVACAELIAQRVELRLRRRRAAKEIDANADQQQA